MKADAIMMTLLTVLLPLALSACALSQEGSIETLYSKAERGNAEAQFELAEAYKEGRGIEQDVYTAADWYRKAGEQNYIDAQLALYHLFPWHASPRGELVELPEEERKERDRQWAEIIEGSPITKTEAEEWYVRAARLGHIDAQYNIGNWYVFRVGALVGNSEAKEFLRFAAEQDYKDAALQLGGWYYNDAVTAGDLGIYDSEGYAGAAKYLLMAERGERSNDPSLAAMYRDGNGVPQDYVEAYIRFSICHAMGYSRECTDSEVEEVAVHLSPEELSYAQEEITRYLNAYGEYRR